MNEAVVTVKRLDLGDTLESTDNEKCRYNSFSVD